ncbi:hypothetical protein CDIOL_16450 [Clostridium diolis]|uniref:Uncharacterized protein n=1 Tax=Clostridium diolis TaxID=223919 RepID=A0AAV3VXR5_9CLOT|nr:hypothetical protein CDIOL_16450 [Clostridium diolis]
MNESRKKLIKKVEIYKENIIVRYMYLNSDMITFPKKSCSFKMSRIMSKNRVQNKLNGEKYSDMIYVTNVIYIIL